MGDNRLKEAAAAAQRIVSRLERIQRFLELDTMRLESNQEIILRRKRGELVARKCDPGIYRVEDVLTGSEMLDLATDWDTALPFLLDDEESILGAAVKRRQTDDAQFEQLMAAYVKDPRSGLSPEEQQECLLDPRLQELVRHWYDKKMNGNLWWTGLLTAWRNVAARLALSQEASDDLTQLVTLDQMASWIKRKKRTLENWKTKDDDFPLPSVEGGGGRADLFFWPHAVEYLRKKSGMPLPDRIADFGSAR